MASTPSQINALTSEVSLVQQQAALLLASIGQGQFDPETIKENIQAATQEAIDEVLSQLDGLDVTELAARSELQRRLMEIMNSVDPDSKFFFEFFNSLYTVSDTITIPGVSTVAGDDSVDISTTTGLIIGREYVIETATQQATVVVSEILSDTRFTVQNNIPISMTGATLRRTNWTFGNLHATAKADQVLYTKMINLDVTVPSHKAVVIRRSEIGDDLNVYFMDGSRPIWQSAPWKWKRASSVGFVNGGEDIDVEYVVPVTGNFQLKIVAASNVTVKHIVGVSRDTRLKGTHRPPNTPVNASPAKNAVDIGKIPTLQLSAYSHPALTKQAGVEFQISKSETDFAGINLVFSTGTIGASTGYSVPATALVVSTEYFWRARVTDQEGGISAWSTPTKFTTANSFATFLVSTPSVATPVNAAENIAKSPTLSGSTFSGIGGDAIHSATQYQVAGDATFASPQYDSGTDVVNRTNVTLSEAQALAGGEHFVRLRQQGTFVWEDTSDGVAAALGTGVITYTRVVPLDETRAVVCYADAGDSAKGKAAVVTVAEDGTVAVGTPVAFYAAATTYISASKVDADKVLVGFVSTSSYAYAVPLTITGNTIAVGTVLTVASVATNFTAMEKFDTLKAVFAINNTASAYGQAYVLTVSGTTVTAGAVLTFNAATTASISLAALDNTKVIAAYRDSTTYGAAIVLSISGTTITAGAEATFTGTAAATFVSIMAYNATTALVGYLDGGDSTKGKAKLLTIAGTVITAAATATAITDVSLTEMFVTKIDSTRALVTTIDNPATLSKARVIFLNNGTELIVSPAKQFATGTLTAGSCGYGANGKVVVAYNLGTVGKVERLKVWNNAVWSEWSGASSFSVKVFSSFVLDIGNSKTLYLRSAVCAPDGSIIAVGQECDSTGGASFNGLIVKLATDGTPVWQKTIGDHDHTDILFSVCQTSDGSFVAVGYEDTTTQWTDRGLVVKFSLDGTIAWQKSLSGLRSLTGVCAGAGGVFYASGTTYSDGQTSIDAVFLKFSSDGTVVWQKSFGATTTTEVFESICCTSDGSIIAAGRQNYSSGNSSDAYCVKLYDSGTVVNSYSLIAQYEGMFNSVCATPLGGWIAVGGHEENTVHGTNNTGFIVCFSQDGTVVWKKSLGWYGYFYGVCQTEDGNYVAVGIEATSSNGVSTKACIVKFSSNGTILWQKSLGCGTSNNAMFFGVCSLTGGGCFAMGFEGANNRGMAASFSPDGLNASGVIPSIPALAFVNPGFETHDVTNTTMTNQATTVNATVSPCATSALPVANPGLLSTLSSY